MIWNPERERMSRAELEALQLERLQLQVRRAYEAVPFYREAFQARGLSPEDIRSLADLTLMPFTR
ncbi:MAG: hypothetical protein ACOYEW_16700 [Anaerolineae bacterium]